VGLVIIAVLLYQVLNLVLSLMTTAPLRPID
jgi:hypothetical protein